MDARVGADHGWAVLTGLVAVLGAVGWALWFLARQDARTARSEALAATDRARLSEVLAETARAGEETSRAVAGAAEARSRVYAVENRSLRTALADAKSKTNGQPDRKPDDLFDSTSGRMRIYRAKRDTER